MERAPRLLLVSTSMDLGGAQRQVADLGVQMRRRGWDVAILCMLPWTPHYRDEVAAAGIETPSLDMAQGRATPAALLRYAAIVRRLRPTVIHSHMVHANLLARLGRVLNPSVPVVCTVHSLREGPRWRELAYRFTDPLASVTTAVSAASVERYVRVGAAPPGRILHVPNGFAASHAAVPEGTRASMRSALGVGDAFVWLAAGRLVPVKAYDVLLRAFAVVRQERPEARLLIAGDGPEADALRRLADSLGLASCVSLLGARRDLPAVMAAADAFVSSSHWEGLPMVLLEAAAAQLPIVATDVGGCAEVARPELGAALVATEPQALAGAMRSLMERSVAERAAIGERLRHLVLTEFDIESVGARWEEIYRGARRGAVPAGARRPLPS